MLDVSLDYCAPTTRLFLNNLYRQKRQHVPVGQNTLDLSSIPNGYVTIIAPLEIPVEQFVEELPKQLASCLTESLHVQLDMVILLHLYIIDRFFAEIVGYKNHIYSESDDEIVKAVQAYQVGDFSASAITQELQQLAYIGMIYRFFLAKKFLYLGFGKSQLRLCSWGREYIEEWVFQHHSYTARYRQMYDQMHDSIYKILLPFREEYRLYIDILLNERHLDEEAFNLRKSVPYKVVI